MGMYHLYSPRRGSPNLKRSEFKYSQKCTRKYGMGNHTNAHLINYGQSQWRLQNPSKTWDGCCNRHFLNGGKMKRTKNGCSVEISWIVDITQSIPSDWGRRRPPGAPAAAWRTVSPAWSTRSQWLAGVWGQGGAHGRGGGLVGISSSPPPLPPKARRRGGGLLGWAGRDPDQPLPQLPNMDGGGGWSGAP